MKCYEANEAIVAQRHKRATVDATFVDSIRMKYLVYLFLRSDNDIERNI